MPGFELNRFLKTVIPSELQCSICKQVMKDPIMCRICNIWLCLQCSQAACNIGNEKHNYTEINKFIKNKIEEYMIRCKYYSFGCVKTLKVKEVEKHEETCPFEKLKEKSLNLPSEISKFSSEICPTSKFKCSVCNAEMLMNEKNKHNCIESLLSFVDNLENQVNIFTHSNKKVNEENIDLENRIKNTAENGKKQQIITLEKIQNLVENKLPEIRRQLNDHIQNREKLIENKCNEFQTFTEEKYEKFCQKSQIDLDNLKKKLNNSIVNYNEKIQKTLFDFNLQVQADAWDLTRIPSDMKEYDENPLRSYANVNNGEKK